MEFKKDKPYTFPRMMAYGFFREGNHILADCHLYFGENSFEALLWLTEPVFRTIVKQSDDKTGDFEKACSEWLAGDAPEIFLPDSFPEPVHCKLTDIPFHFVKSETEEDEFGEEHIFHFSVEPQPA